MSGTGLSYCQIMVGRAMTGVIGLQEVMEALEREGLAPDAPGLGQRLLEDFRKHNYVPESARRAYEEALLREYRKYLEAKRSGSAGRLWRDPRKEHKPWYPTIFEAKCDGCGMCLPVCPNNVLGWNTDRTKVLVLEPYECAPGCEQCAKSCKPKAIVMPPRAVLYQRMESVKGTVASECKLCTQEDCESCP